MAKKGESPYRDIIIITAVYEEYLACKHAFPNGREIKHHADYPFFEGASFYRTMISSKGPAGKSFSVLISCMNHMGMVPASVFTQLLLKANGNKFPKLIAMCGIAAGVGDGRKERDIMIAEMLWDYGVGKYSTDPKDQNKVPIFTPYRYPIMVRKSLIRDLLELKYEKGLTQGFRASFITNDEYEKSKVIHLFKETPEIHIGPFASGAGVVSSSKMLNDIKSQEGKLIGFDMEAYGVAFAINSYSNNPKNLPYIIIKSVSDKGDENKGENKELKQKYAAFTSAKLLHKLITEHSAIFGM
jgi:nucleoside phosphorylase